MTYLTAMREYMYKLQITKAYVCNEVKVLCNALKLSVYWYAVLLGMIWKGLSTYYYREGLYYRREVIFYGNCKKEFYRQFNF